MVAQLLYVVEYNNNLELYIFEWLDFMVHELISKRLFFKLIGIQTNPDFSFSICIVSSCGRRKPIHPLPHTLKPHCTSVQFSSVAQ